MKVFKGIPLWALIFGLLLFANLGCMCWSWFYNASLRSAAKEFKFVNYYTNDVACIGIEEAKTGKPLLINWDFGDGEKPGEVSYFFHGTNVLNIYLKKGRPPQHRFIFHGPGKSEMWWMDRGNGSFTERIYYDTNGDFSKHEVWYNQTWYPVDRRNEHNGIIVDEQWHQLGFDMNGMWTIEAPTKAP